MRPGQQPPRIPNDHRLVELTSEGIAHWYRIHAGESLVCGCSLKTPDRDCNVGEALYRLSAAARDGKLDERRLAA